MTGNFTCENKISEFCRFQRLLVILDVIITKIFVVLLSLFFQVVVEFDCHIQ